MAPSRYVFQPHPGPDVERIASAQGQALSRAMTAYLADPKIGPFITAPVARAVLGSAAAKADPSYAARTLAGILMGFVPTLDGNMRRILMEWAREGTLWALRTGNLRDAKKATCSLRESLFNTMQLRAAPEQLWRTAVTTHQLGDKPHAVELRPGDVVVAGLISANHEGLEGGNSELFPAFGGERKTEVQVPPGQARHACPGQGPAMAVLEGFLRGLMTCPHPLRPGPTGLTFLIRGSTSLPAGRSEKDGAEFGIAPMKTDPARADTVHIPTMAVGDSWLTKIPTIIGVTSLLNELIEIGFDPVKGKDKLTAIGYRLEWMAEDNQLTILKRSLHDALDGGTDIKAILLDGGGNDLVFPVKSPKNSVLFEILTENLEKKSGKITIDNNDALKGFILRVKDRFGKICNLMIATQDKFNRKDPILIHGYGYPTVSGIGVGEEGRETFGPWLKPIFDHAKFSEDLGARNQAMIDLIDALNVAIAEISNNSNNRIHHIDLRKTFKNVASKYDGTDPNFYNNYWSNELHPSKTGCKLNAAVYLQKLIDLQIVPDPNNAGAIK